MKKSLIKKILQREGGYSLIELIVAIQLTLIVISLGYLGYVFTIKLAEKWQHKVEVENQLSVISHLISKNMNEVSKFVSANSNEFIALKHDKKRFQLSFRSGLSVNRKSLDHENLKFKHGVIIYYIQTRKTGNKLNVKKSLIPEELTAVRGIGIKLTFMSNKREYSVEIFSRLLKIYKNIYDR